MWVLVYLSDLVLDKPPHHVLCVLITLQPRRPIWQDTLLSEDRELEKVGLTNFNRKANYLRNSRYSKTTWSNTASSGPIKMKPNISLKEGYVASAASAVLIYSNFHRKRMSFIAEPEEVQFTGYSVGETYKVRHVRVHTGMRLHVLILFQQSTLELKNISAVSRQLRLIPLKSDHFKVTPLACPTADGVIAPGLCASYTVSFTPESLSNYQAEFQVYIIRYI